MTVSCRFFTPEEYDRQEKARRAAIDAWMAEHGKPEGGWPPELVALNNTFFPPGSMWLCPWYHDPADPEDLAKVDERIARLEREPDAPVHLSIHYWRDHARRRPPICVVCPGGGHWVVDSKSTNGDGWTVTGEPPLITCSPSIWVGQGAGPPREYHGFLQNGVFTPPL